jgi:hypothetical protein
LTACRSGRHVTGVGILVAGQGELLESLPGSQHPLAQREGDGRPDGLDVHVHVVTLPVALRA